MKIRVSPAYTNFFELNLFAIKNPANYILLILFPLMSFKKTNIKHFNMSYLCLNQDTTIEPMVPEANPNNFLPPELPEHSPLRDIENLSVCLARPQLRFHC